MIKFLGISITLNIALIFIIIKTLVFPSNKKEVIYYIPEHIAEDQPHVSGGGAGGKGIQIKHTNGQGFYK
jgi:hypothetical protein